MVLRAQTHIDQQVFGEFVIKARGEDHQVKSNTGRRRVNINGAIDLEHLEPVTRFAETIDATSTIALFQQLEQVYAVGTWIYVICDNARYYRSKAVQGSKLYQGSPHQACLYFRLMRPI